MIKSVSAAALLSFVSAVTAGTIVWDGSFTPYTSPSDFDKWSWSNEVGTYQWYIHGSSATSAYLNLDPSYKNPADVREDKGLKLTVDSTSHWNGQTMMRTELIPQTSQNLGTGQMYYHFSIMHQATNPPGTSEHQIMFFESHFTELKVGIGSDLTKLNWCIQGNSQWSTTFTAGTWYNFAYDINFSAGTVGLWGSTGSAPLARIINNMSASPSTNSEDWHVGVLRLGDTSTEDWYISGVYIESGSLTTSIGTGTGTNTTVVIPQSSTSTTSSSSSKSSSTSSSSSKTSSSSTKASSTTSSSSSGGTGTAAHWGQCGGIGWTGPTQCVSGTTCTELNSYYYQCL